MGARYLDPFGATEYLVEGVAYREMIGPDLIRFGFFVTDGGERVLRVRLVIPVKQLVLENDTTRQFLAHPKSALVLFH